MLRHLEDSAELDVDINGGQYNTTWFDPNGLGPFWSIMSYDGQIMYYAGTLCGDAIGRKLAEEEEVVMEKMTRHVQTWSFLRVCINSE